MDQACDWAGAFAFLSDFEASAPPDNHSPGDEDLPPLLRGGADGGRPVGRPRLPFAKPKARLRGKGPLVRVGRALGAGGGPSPGLTLVAGAADGGAARVDGAGAPSDYVWVLAELTETTPVGAVHIPSSEAAYFDILCLDRPFAGSSGIHKYQKLLLTHVDQYASDRTADFKKYLGLSTPRKGAGDGLPTPRKGAGDGPRPGFALLGGGGPVATADPIPRTFAIALDSGGSRHRDMREFMGTVKTIDVESWPLKGPGSLLWVLQVCIAQTGGGPSARVSQLGPAVGLDQVDTQRWVGVGICPHRQDLGVGHQLR